MLNRSGTHPSTNQASLPRRNASPPNHSQSAQQDNPSLGPQMEEITRQPTNQWIPAQVPNETSLRMSPLQRARDAWTHMFASYNGGNETDIQTNTGNRPLHLSLENQRANDPWGDSIEAKPHHTTRLYALNLTASLSTSVADSSMTSAR